MNKQDKELLLKDLCARLPYKVKVYGNFQYTAGGKIFDDKIIEVLDYSTLEELKHGINVKPYLRPMESITEEEKKIYNGFVFSTDKYGKICEFDDVDYLRDWLDANHFDHRGLIPKGLAIEAPKDMYNFK